MTPPAPSTEHIPTAALWGQFAAPLRSFLTKRAPREIDPEDLLQEVFLRIQAQLPNLRDAERIEAWIFQIARNVVADGFRKRTRREALAHRDLPQDLEVVTDEDERDAEGALVSCLASIVAQLPEPYREAIQLTEIRGVTQTEAAGVVGLSISGMKSRVQRGREHLKRAIHAVCVVETDVRGRVIGCDPRDGARCFSAPQSGGENCGEELRPSPDSRDSIDMTNTNQNIAETHNPNQKAEGGEQAAETGCCGGAAPRGSSACCALDADVKASGGSGCGCSPKASTTTATPKKGCC